MRHSANNAITLADFLFGTFLNFIIQYRVHQGTRVFSHSINQMHKSKAYATRVDYGSQGNTKDSVSIALEIHYINIT